jgi:hypothetical protein
MSDPIWRFDQCVIPTNDLEISMCRLEKLNGIAERVIEDDLRAAYSFQYLVPKVKSLGSQAVHFQWKIGNRYLDTIPAARDGSASIRHRSSARTLGSTQQ